MQEIQLGRVYRHFKGDYYLVEAVAHDSETGAPCVIYRKLYGDFELTSIRGKIKRIQTRLDELDKAQASAASGPVEDQHDGYTYRENNEIMRVQFIFPGKPDDETRAMLKENGFRWAPSQGAWQRQLTANAKYAAHRVMEFLDGNENE